MSTRSNVNSGYPNLRLTRGTPLSQPTSSSTPRSASVLNNANNTRIDRSVFTTNSNTYNVSLEASSLGVLHQSVAPNAILNSGGRADEVRCHPGTREELIGLVEKSISEEYSGPRLLWLSGPAGAGKSAIMQTVAERCKDRGAPHANFFFFRADSSRKDVSPFVATIMHQIIQRYPSVGPAVAAALASDPLLFQMGVQQQFDVLLNHALATLHHTPPSLPPLTLLIDGLDECDSENKTGQRQLLQALDTLLTLKGPYFRVVVASRVEPQISMAFSQLRSQVDSIFLDEKYSPENDIHRFVTAEFDKIKSSHYLASILDPEWPSESDIADIVLKSSGQFIFAATVMRFISHSPASPILSLQKVQGIVPPNKNSPFAQIDAVYAYILGQVEDLDAVQVILAIRILDSDYNHAIPDMMVVYQPGFSRAVFDSCLSELAPLVSIERGKLEFFHASFPDFLCNQSRSREYHIDLEGFCAGAFPIWWRNQSSLSVKIALLALQKVAQPTSEITTALMEHDASMKNFDRILIIIGPFIHDLHRMYARNGLYTFRKIMDRWVSNDPELARYIPQEFRSISQNRQTHPFAPYPHPSTPQTHPYSSQKKPLTHQMRSSTSKMRPSTFHPRPSTSQTRPSTSQACSPTSHTRPFDRQALPSIPQTHPSTSQTRLSTSQQPPSRSPTRPLTHQMYSSTSMTRPSTFRPRPRPRPSTSPRSSTPQMRLSTPQAQPPTPQTYPFDRQALPPIPQTLPSTSQTRPSASQKYPTIARKMDHEAPEKGIPSDKRKSGKRL